MKIWRTDPGIFIQAVVERSKSYIPSDVALQYPPELLERQKLGDAFRGLQRGLIVRLCYNRALLLKNLP